MTCKDCIHHVVCNRPDPLDIGCEDFSDRSEWVKLPCNVGTTVYFVYTQDENKKNLDVGKIISFSVEENVLWAFVRYESGLSYWHPSTEFGKIVFFTREDAERALKERESNDE